MNSKQRDSGGIARRLFCLGSARLRSLLLMPVMIAWALLGVALLGVVLALFSMRRRNRETKKTVPYGISWSLLTSRAPCESKSRSPALWWDRQISWTRCRCQIERCTFRARRLGPPTSRYSIRLCS